MEIKTETVKTHTVGESVGHRAAHGDGAEIHPYSGHVNFSRDVGPYAAKVAGAVMEFLRDTLVKLLSKLGVLLFNFCVMLFVMYQFFYDGRHMLAYIKSISPLSDDAMKRVETRVREVSRAVVYGIFGTAVTQGICAMLFFKLAGIPVFWGVVLGICSIIPVVGTSLIWVPVVVYLFLIGAYGKAVFIFITCGCIVANFDMILRPLLMKRSGETGMSYMVLFLSILGGIQTFGLVGIIYGPMITGICSICLLIFSTQFKAKRELEENKETEGELQG
ncbi:MAG: AI-2E family transporter [Victivallales bacterium]|nr:AI-2E family transporter [Victivallales bacterium]